MSKRGVPLPSRAIAPHVRSSISKPMGSPPPPRVLLCPEPRAAGGRLVLGVEMGFGNGEITGQIELGFFPRLPENLRIAQATSALLQGHLSAAQAA